MREYKTLGVLRQELAERLGYGNMTPSSHPAILVSFLKDAQDQLIEDYEDVLLKDIREDIALLAGQTQYDFPAGFDHLEIQQVAIIYGSRYLEMTRGIDLLVRDIPTPSIPTYWDMRYDTTPTTDGKLEVFPAPDQNYTMAISANRTKSTFEADGDQTSIPSHMVFLVALANAKAHYQQADAAVVGNQAENLRRNIKAKQTEGKVYDRSSKPKLDSTYVRKVIV